jgi:hypothetical protein
MQAKLPAALGCDGGKNWDEDENFNGLAVVRESAQRRRRANVNGTYCE